MQYNKYLHDLGIPIEGYGTNFTLANDPRSPEWEREHQIYGFDSRECWDLDRTYTEWLYSHLMKYLEDAGKIINLDSHEIEYKGQIYTQKEMIEAILKLLRNGLTMTQIVQEKQIKESVQEATRMWAEIVPYCWW